MTAPLLLAPLGPGLLPRLSRLAGLPASEVDPETARQRAREILAAREFKRPEPGWLDKAREWLQDRFVSLMEQLFSGGGGAAATWILVAVILAALGVLIYRLTRTVQADPSVRMAMSVAVRRSAEDWRAEASRFEADGEWKEALRCRFRALIGDLVDLGQLRDVPGRTAGEYRRELRETAPMVADDFSQAAELFEQAWYGHVDTGPEENARFRALADHLVSGLRS